MKVHHLNCGTMHPPATPEGLVCHVLLAEADSGLVLVDSGFGLRDIAEPGRRIGLTRHLIRPVLDQEETAVHQVERLGFKPSDVRDIVLTHFDADHTGGLADFPHARVHLTAAEAQAALHPRTMVERARYLAAQREHGPHLVEHDPLAGDSWHGFPSAIEILPGVLLIGLPGHTQGHAAVAVDADRRWIMHTGDAFYHRAQIGDGRTPLLLTGMEQSIAHNRRLVRANHERLRTLRAASGPDLLVVNAHDPVLLQEAREQAYR